MPHSRDNGGAIDICAITDKGYFVPTIVMLTSAKLNKNADSHYRIHLFLTEEDSLFAERVQRLHSHDFEIILQIAALNETERQFDENRLIKHISGATMVRCRLPYLLPELRQVLYLDGDIIVLKDLSEFFHQPMQNKTLAGCWSMAADFETKEVKWLGATNYLNAGVLLMNLERMRERGMGEAMAQAMQNHRWSDQDILNVLCPDEEKLILPPRYNCMLSRGKQPDLKWDFNRYNAFYGTSYSSEAEVEDDALLLHLAAQLKPWHYLNIDYSELWIQYYRKSPYGRFEWNRDIYLAPERIAELVANDKGLQQRETALRTQLQTAQNKQAQSMLAKVQKLNQKTQQLKERAQKLKEKLTPDTHRTSRIRLLGFLPFLKLQDSPASFKLRLFHFLPLWTVHRREGVSRYLLLGCIPLFTKATRSWKER